MGLQAPVGPDHPQVTGDRGAMHPQLARQPGLPAPGAVRGQPRRLHQGLPRAGEGLAAFIPFAAGAGAAADLLPGQATRLPHDAGHGPPPPLHA
jgi:hypothetical protein